MLFDTRERWEFHQSANSYKLERDSRGEPMPVLRLPLATMEEKGRRIDGVDGGSRSLLEGDSVCREGRIFWAIVREKTRGRRATKNRDRRTSRVEKG